MTGPDHASGRNTALFFTGLVVYFGLHLGLRLSLSGSLDYDEAEQAMLAQWLLPGYTEQPPLYSWLQFGFFSLLGKNVFAVALLRNLLLLLTYVFVYQSAREVLRDSRTAILATLSLLFIPQIAWESQRDMSHTLLVVCAAAATFWQALRLMRRSDWLSYMLLGLTLATGILAKSNYSLFVIILLVTMATFPEGRRAVANRRMAAALALAVTLTSPYLYWMYSHQDILFGTTHKFKQGRNNYLLIGPLSLVRSSLFFLAPLLVVFTAVFFRGLRGQSEETATLANRFLRRYIIITFLVVLTVVLLFKVTYVKDRWLQPLLFIFPVLLFAHLDRASLTPARIRAYGGAIGAAACAVYIAFTLRVVAAEPMDRFCRLNYPMTEVAGDLAELGFTKGLIVSDDRFLAGNLSLSYPDSTAIIPGYRFESQAGPISQLALVWNRARNEEIPETLSTFLRSRFLLDPATVTVHHITRPYLYADHSKVELAGAIITLPAPRLVQ